MRIANGGSLSSAATDELLLFTGGSYTGGGVLGTASGGSLLRMFSETGQSGTSQTLAGPYLGSSGGTTFLCKDAPMFNIADGATITSTGPAPFASFTGGSVTSASSFFSLDTNTSFTVSGVMTVGSGNPVSVSIAGTLIEGIDTTFTTPGSFLRLRNGVSLTQTGSAPLILLTGSSPGSVVVEADGNFVGMSAASGLPAPSLTLAGPLVSAETATIRSGDPTSNTFTNVFVGDGAELTSTSTSALMSLTDSTVDTAGNILTLRRSSAVATPSKVTPSGPLFSAGGGGFNTTSLGNVTSACCDGFFVGQGAQLTSSAASPLISLSGSTFTALDSQSGGDFFGEQQHARPPRRADLRKLGRPARHQRQHRPLFSITGGTHTLSSLSGSASSMARHSR